jgi:hypothetical protein
MRYDDSAGVPSPGAIVMKCSFAAALMICLSATALLAQFGARSPDDPTLSKWTENKLENPPAREIKFETSDEPLQKRLTRPDPKLLEQKFVALLRIDLPNVGGRSREPRFQHDGSAMLLDLVGQERMGGPRGQSARLTEKDIARMVKQMPEKLRPEAAKLDFLKPDRSLVTISGQVYSVLGSRGLGGEEERQLKSYREFQILAPSEEVAQERAKTLLHLLDQGMFRPIQLVTWKYRAAEIEAYLAAKKRRSELSNELKALNQQAAEYADFTADMLPGIRLQQTQLDINLADVKARLAACDKLLETGVAKETKQKIEETKIACLIELAGLEAGRAKSEEQMKKVKATIELTGKRDQLSGSLASAGQILNRHERNLAGLEEDLDDFAPPTLADGKVVIKPLVWTQ